MRTIAVIYRTSSPSPNVYVEVKLEDRVRGPWSTIAQVLGRLVRITVTKENQFLIAIESGGFYNHIYADKMLRRGA